MGTVFILLHIVPVTPDGIPPCWFTQTGRLV